MMAIAGKNVETQPTDAKSTERGDQKPGPLAGGGSCEYSPLKAEPPDHDRHQGLSQSPALLKRSAEDNSACSNMSCGLAVGCEGKKDKRVHAGVLGCPGGLPDALNWWAP